MHFNIVLFCGELSFGDVVYLLSHKVKCTKQYIKDNLYNGFTNKWVIICSELILTKI